MTIPTGVPLVTVSSGVQSLNSLNSASPILATGTSQLTIGRGGATLSADLTLNGATVHGGNIAISGASLIGTSAGGTLDGATLTGNIDLSQSPNAALNIMGGLTLNGMISIGNSAGTTSGILSFTGNVPEAFEASAGGSAAVVFGAGRANDIINSTDYIAFGNYTGSGEIVTFGSGVSIGGIAGGVIGSLTGDQIINQGRISSTVPGGEIDVGASLLNQGSVSVANGATLSLDHVSGNLGLVSVVSGASTLALSGAYTVDQPIAVDSGSTLTLGGSWQNTNTITLNASTLELNGSFTTAGLGTIHRTAGTITLFGVLDNTNAVLDLTDIGPVNLPTDGYHSRGIIRGGVIDAPGTTPLLIGDGGMLDGVTVDGNLAGYLTIIDNLVLNGTMDVSGQLVFGNNLSGSNPASESITGNATLLLQNSATNTGYIMNESGLPAAPGTLTLGPNVLITGCGAIDSSGGALANYATIVADVPSKAINIYYAAPLTNNGSLSATSGAELNASGLTGNLGAASVSGAGSALILQGTDYVLRSNFSVPAGTTLELDGTWQNSATISVAGGTLNLGGGFTVGGMGVIDRSGLGTINLTGTLDNSGNTLTFDSVTGSWNLDGGGIVNGNVVELEGAGLVFVTNGGGVLDGVNFQGDLDLSQVRNASLGIADGLTLNGRILLGNSTGTTYGGVYFGGRASQTLAVAPGGSANIVMGESFQNTIQDLPFRSISNTVTFGNGVVINAAGGSISELTSRPALFINDGSFSIAPNVAFYSQAPFLNNGEFLIGSGAILHSENFANSGSLTLSPNATLSVEGFPGTFTQSAGGITIDQLGDAQSVAGGQIIAAGTATLDGALQVNLPAGENLPPGATIPVVTATTRAGAFANFATSPASDFVRVQYGASSAYLVTGGDSIAGTSANDTITLTADANGKDIDWNAGSINGFLPISDPNGLIINGNGGTDTITLSYAMGNPLPSTLHLNGRITIAGLQNLNGKTLDIGKSTLFVNYAGNTDPVGWIRSALAAGFAAGTWRGVPSAVTGVITTMAGSKTYGIGYADAADQRGVDTVANSVELKYTLFGDANLDGLVNAADLLLLRRASQSPAEWDNGDFNYDGKVDATDLLILLQNARRPIAVLPILKLRR